MTTRIQVSVSMQPKDVKIMKELADEMGLKPSELIREMLYKTKDDAVGKDIILRRFVDENREKLTKERLLRIMSIRSNLKKAGANPNHDTGAVSSIDQGNYSDYSRIQQAQESWEQKVIETIEACKKQWLEEKADGR